MVPPELRTRSLWALGAALPLAAVLAVVACSSMGEGERCQLDSYASDKSSEDCADGLICVASKDLPLAPEFRGQVSDREGRCCPADRTKATVDVCKQPPPTAGADAGIPAEAGTAADAAGTADATGSDGGADAAPDASGTDAASEASTDAGDAASDAPTGG